MFRLAQQRDRRTPTTRAFAVRIPAIAVLAVPPVMAAPSALAANDCGPGEAMIGQIHGIATCPDGTAWVADTWGLVAPFATASGLTTRISRRSISSTSSSWPARGPVVSSSVGPTILGRHRVGHPGPERQQVSTPGRRLQDRQPRDART